MAVIKKILDSERTFPHQICPKCPVFFDWKLRNYLIYREIRLSTSICPDICAQSTCLTPKTSPSVFVYFSKTITYCINSFFRNIWPPFTGLPFPVKMPTVVKIRISHLTKLRTACFGRVSEKRSFFRNSNSIILCFYKKPYF